MEMPFNAMLHPNEPKVGIVVLNWNSWRDTIECLDSLMKIEYQNFSIFLVENGSEDGSLDHILSNLNEVGIERPDAVVYLSNGLTDRMAFDLFRDERLPRLTILVNEHNNGFAGGNNLTLPFLVQGGYDYVLLLNNDTIVATNLVGELVAGALRNPDGGFFGPLVMYYDYSGRMDVINFAGGAIDLKRGTAKHRGMNEVDIGQYSEDERVGYVEGSCLFMPVKLFWRLGGFNHCFFAYWEENDLQLRGAKWGYASYLIPTTRIWHKVSGSASSSVKSYFFARNRIWLVRLHATPVELLYFIPYYFLAVFPYEICNAYKRGGRKGARKMIAGIRDGLLFPAITED